MINGGDERTADFIARDRDAARFRRWFGKHQLAMRAVLLSVLSACFVFTWFLTIQRLLRYYTAIPEFDYWRTAMFLEFYRRLDRRVLWIQHNEHRIVFPEIAFAADYLLLHGRQLIPLALSFLCYFGNWVVLSWTFCSATEMPAFLRAVGTLLAGILIGWQGSAVVLASPFLLQWSLTQVTVLLSLTFLVSLKATQQKRYLVAVIICSIIATYSSGNGLLLWPILIGAGLVLPLRRAEIIGLVLAGAVSIGVYFIGYHFTGTLSLVNLIHHPFYLLKFVGSYLGLPFSEEISPQLAAWLGIASMSIVAIAALPVIRARLLATRTGIVLFGSYLYMVLTGVLIAAGRMDPADPRFENARPQRYLMGPLVAWSIFILLCLWVISKFVRSTVAPYAAAAIFSVLLAVGLPKLSGWLHARDADFANAQLAALAMDNDLLDPGVILNIFPWDPARVEAWSRGLREHHLSIFYHAHSKWIGRPIRAFSAPVKATVAGEITYTYPVLNGIEVAGWSDPAQLRDSSGWLLFANEREQVVGFGRKLPAGFPHAVQNPRTPSSLGWVGFVNLRDPTAYVSAFAIDRRGLIPLEGSVPVPRVRVVSAEQIGPEIPTVAWQMDKTWTANRLPQDQYLGRAPAGTVYGSWSGKDANTGRITSSIFPAPANACVILPIVQGPRAGGLFAGIVNADTDEIIASVPFQDAPQQWDFWGIPLAPGVKRLQVVAEDGGRERGEWLAISNPRLCQ